MRIKARDARQGLHPHEMIVVIDTLTGPEELVVDERSGHVASVEVGYPVAVHGTNYLVELPSETSTGAWRVWVHEKAILGGAVEAAE